MFQTYDPTGAGPVLTPGASYEQSWQRSTRRCYIPNIKALHFLVSEKKNFEDFLLCSYVLNLKLLGAGPVLTLGDSYEQSFQKSTRRCYIPNIKALHLLVSEEKNFKVFSSLVLCFELVTPGAGPVLTPGASYVQSWQRSTRRYYIPNIKALHLLVSEKKNFKVFLLCSYVSNL